MTDDVTTLLEQITQLKDAQVANEAKIAELTSQSAQYKTESETRQAEIVRLQGLVAHYVSTPDAPPETKPKSFNERYSDYLKAVSNKE